MGWRDIGGDNQRWRERWRDPILTALLVLLSLDVFVIIPLGHFGLRNRLETHIAPRSNPVARKE
jgi:hypothetical protein